MPLTPKETKLSSRPTGGYDNNTKTLTGGAGELASERVTAPELKSGPTPRQWDGKRVPSRKIPTTDPLIDIQSRTCLLYTSDAADE